jgi:general secretion pathway protein A
MSYFNVLGFDKEPFSTSPDPDFFYLSHEHETALTKLLIELRLKRGLSVILGDVGTGKTSLSRKLIQELNDREDIVFHIILDPSFDNETLFLTSLIKNFDIRLENLASATIVDLREALERFLFQKGVTENKTVALIIDEAQKLDDNFIEVLRVLLNYETNKFKLLQLVLLGQMELYSKITMINNFFDRISFKYTFNSFDFNETKEMIDFRIRQAGYRASMQLFSDDAIKEIYQYSRGYPRKIIMLCHRALESLVLRKKIVIDGDMIKQLIEDEVKLGWRRNDLLVQKNSY